MSRLLEKLEAALDAFVICAPTDERACRLAAVRVPSGTDASGRSGCSMPSQSAVGVFLRVRVG